MRACSVQATPTFSLSLPKMTALVPSSLKLSMRYPNGCFGSVKFPGETCPFFTSFPISVPSLCWQIGEFQHKMVQKNVSAPSISSIRALAAACKNAVFFFEFSLRLSRACLDKMTTFRSKVAQNTVFLPAAVPASHHSDLSAGCSRRESNKCQFLFP